MLVATNPSLPNALLSVHIATCTLEFSVGFAKLGAMFYILDIQQRIYQTGRWAMFIAIGVNVCVREDSWVNGIADQQPYSSFATL